MNINPEHQAKEEQIRNLEQELIETQEEVMQYQNLETIIPLMYITEGARRD